MFNNKRIVCVTPAGRQRYLSILKDYILRECGFVDEWHLWVNTGNNADIDYMRKLELRYSCVKMIRSSSPHAFCSGRIGSFLPSATCEDTIYVRFDDDVVWVEMGAIKKLVDYKLAHPELFLVGGNVINNPLSTYRQRLAGGLIIPEVQDCYNDNRGLDNLNFPIELHNQFLQELDKKKFYFPNEVLPIGKRFGIHFICWEGIRFGKFGGVIPHLDEENWLTSEAPLQFNEPTGLCGSALAVHFAYTSQRLSDSSAMSAYDYPDSSIGLLDRYRKLIQ